MVALSLWKVVCCRDFCYYNGWYPCHYGRESVLEIFVIPFDGSFVIMEGSLLSIFLIVKWMVAFSLWKVVCCRVFVTPMDGSLVIMEGSLLSRFLILQWIAALSLWKVVCCRDFCYSNGW